VGVKKIVSGGRPFGFAQGEISAAAFNFLAEGLPPSPLPLLKNLLSQ
jgi:hypothetical protein